MYHCQKKDYRFKRATVLFVTLSALFSSACSSQATPAQSPESTVAAAEPAPAVAESTSSVKDETEFGLKASETAGAARGVTESKIRGNETEAAMKFVVIDKAKGEPLTGIVISLTSPSGTKYYTEQTDATGYAEVLVPVGKKYELVYLSLGKRKISARVPVPDEPNQNIKLTLRYKAWKAPPVPAKAKAMGAQGEVEQTAPAFILNGVQFDSNKAVIRPESFPRLDSVVEFMVHKPNARIEISGHTDSKGALKDNQELSENRAQACKEYLIKQGVAGDRIEAVGYGPEQPIATNENDAGRAKNRRIEAKEL